MGHKATPEQMTCARAFRTGESVSIEAKAGTGKTTTLRYLAHLGSTRGAGRMLYTSFGNRVIAEAKQKFPKDRVHVATNHGLAFGVVGRQYQAQGRLVGRILPSELVQRFSWSDYTFANRLTAREGAHGVLGALRSFWQSADDQITAAHVPTSAVSRLMDKGVRAQMRESLARLAREVWEEQKRSNGDCPVEHDTYLKLFQLKRPVLPYDTIFIDEAQDCSDIMLALILDQPNAQALLVGDSNQAIYGFRGAVDVMERMQTRYRCTLTQSWRFGHAIADAANCVLANHLGASTFLRGHGGIPSELGPVGARFTLLARTNGTLLSEVAGRLSRAPNVRLAVVGGVDEILRLLDGVETLQSGRRTPIRELAEFACWSDVVMASQMETDRHLRVLVDAVETYSVPRLRMYLNIVKGNERTPGACDVLLSTAHKAKGLEFDEVFLADDFPVPAPEGLEDDDERLESNWTPEEGNLLYVAATRARLRLDAEHCGALMDALQRQR